MALCSTMLPSSRPRPVGVGRTFPALVAALLVALLPACSKASEDRWNVVVVTLDTTRADSLSCYGRRPRAKTPVMDALASEGVRFDRAQSVCSVTPVSHASILTGLWQYHHGVRVIAGTGGFYLPENVPHLGEKLKELGWTTLAVHSAFPVSSYFGFDRAFDRFDSVETDMSDEGGGFLQWDWKQFQRRSDDSVDRTLRYLDQLGDAPFFLWLHLWDPHDSGKLPPDEFMTANVTDPNAGNWDRIQSNERRYELEVQYMDEQLGRLVEHFKRSGKYDRTLFVITSDHGDGLGEHDWLAHRLVYQEQLEVPLLMKWPGGPEGKVVTGVASSVDIVPTVLEAMGIPYDASTMDGQSLLSAIESGVVPQRTLYADQINGYDTNAGMVKRRPTADFLYSVSDGRWKLIWRPSYPHLSDLYDLENDPDEAVNLFGKELEVQRRLARDLTARGSWVEKPIAPLDGHEQTAEAIEALSGLGYMGETEDGQPMALVPTAWAWGCHEHLDVILDDKHATCPHCGEPLLLRTKTPIDRLPPR